MRQYSFRNAAPGISGLLIIFLLLQFQITLGQSSSCPDDLIPQRNLKNGKMGYTDLFENWIINPKYFQTFAFQGRFAKVRRGDTFGFIDCKGTEVIPPEFIEVGFFNLGRLWVKNKEGWQLWDTTGTILNNGAFDDYNRTSINHGYTWVLKDRTWQIVNEAGGKVECDRSFTTLKVLSDSLSMVSDDSYFGILNHKNCEFKIPESIVSAAKVSSRFIKVQYKNRKFDILDNSGNSILQEPYDLIIPAGEGLARARTRNKWGIITPRGKVVLDAQYDSIAHFRNQRIAVLKDQKWTYLDERLKTISESQYKQAGNFSRKGAIVQTESGWGVIDKSGKEIYESDLDNIHDFGKSYAGLKNGHWKILPATVESDSFENLNFKDNYSAVRAKISTGWGVYDIGVQRWKVRPVYEKIDPIPSGFLLVKKEGKTGLIDTLGKVKIRIEYDQLMPEYGFANLLFRTKNGSVSGLIRTNQKVILECDGELQRQGSYFKCNTDKETQMFNSAGELLFDGKYDSLVVFNKDFAIYVKEKWGLIDWKGNELIKAQFLDFIKLSDELLAFKNKDGVWSLYEANGTLISGDKFYEDVLDLHGNKFIVQTTEGIQWLNTNGKLLKKAKEYLIPGPNHICLKISGKWMIYENSGARFDNRTFTAIKKESDKVLFQTGSKWFYISKRGVLSPWLPFD